MKKLTNKVAVVTGASKGIGASIAQHLAAEGAKVVVNYASSKEGADKVVVNIKSDGGEAIAIQADVSKQSDIQRLFEETKAQFGRVDILVNNAGIYEFSPLEQITPAHFSKQFNLNVFGLLFTMQKATEYFDENGGNIINISSVVSKTPFPGASVYSATKAAVDAFTIALSKELGNKKIRVNSVLPGMIETEGTHAAGITGSDMEKQMEAQTPLGRIGIPSDIGKVVTFLASEDAGWITGDTIVVSGGNI
ncbi:SDR family NAD(P)-dependent oxidoreductase [Rhizosphaericola mali]|uniref:Glucose 1-dehydrogenase n=1 Tax=Rhizosphaericola mali TaxID=2545455 RepID=A0A5P2G7L2_9BACT|nr:glucose 1-dehydrogenase [Rhizosphaericola mali]QES90688.1 glucose 1-dehydrogenase [Rhizosphaericola mali]